MAMDFRNDAHDESEVDPDEKQPAVILNLPKALRKPKPQSPQAALDKFWARLQTKHPGKGKVASCHAH